MRKSGKRNKMNGGGEERVCMCMHACFHLCAPHCAPACLHMFSSVSYVFCTICSYANNIKGSFTAGMSKTHRGAKEKEGEEEKESEPSSKIS